MPLVLKGVTKAAAGRQLSLRGAAITIGRDAKNSFAVDDAKVSRQHAKLERREGRWVLLDAGSTNGTFLNGTRITRPHPVKPGDRIVVGKTELVLVQVQAEERKRPDRERRPPRPRPRPLLHTPRKMVDLLPEDDGEALHCAGKLGTALESLVADQVRTEYQPVDRQKIAAGVLVLMAANGIDSGQIEDDDTLFRMLVDQSIQTLTKRRQIRRPRTTSRW